ncbi:unnamed protein product [Arctia plantaginis]|uniref:Reverse transcriptase domain-containing protein n=1 Tax=Arctia plantaginis TaxID=874455 RepID=A0A8S1BHH0_ARCPL|nr:unnamed protein product [Arctia plantaginis]
MGDFNTCLLKNDSRSATLRSVIKSSNLSILSLNPTHNLPNRNSSLLDLILVSSVEHVAKHGQCPADSFSYHDLLFLSYIIRTPKPKAKIISHRNFRNMNVENLRRDADNIDWSPLFNSQCVDEKTDIFTNNLMYLYDKHAPMRQIKVKHLPAPWLTGEIKEIQRKKVRAQSKYKSHPTASNWAKFVLIRNHCNKMCRNAQRRHIHKSVENGDPVKVWKFLKSLGIGKSRPNCASKDIDIDSLNSYFSAASVYRAATKTTTLNYLSSLPIPDCSPFFFSQFAACDVRKSIMSITSTAVGSDSISRKMVLPILDEILPVISHILNYSISVNVFPSAWKMAQIIPLPKKCNPSSFSDYRPISILPFLSKVLERLIHTQLTSFLSRNCLLNPFQSGFRPGHSTTTALVHITDDVRSGMDEGKLTVFALLDFSNAFNTVDFDVLLGSMA